MSDNDPISEGVKTLFDLDPEAELTSDDYGFILTKDGKLKGVFFPNDSIDGEEVPEAVKKILDLFNIVDIDALFNMTLH